MAFSTQRAVSDGTLQDLLLEIEFIDREDIAVLIDNLQPIDSGYTWEWISDSLIRFTPAIANGSEVLLQRNTALDRVLNIFTLGAVFNNPTMDENFRQILYIAQEAREGSTLEEVFRNLNMHGYRIQNLGAGTEPGDAINYQQYMDDALGAGAARVAAEAARNAAQTAQAGASASAGTATTQAGVAVDAANTALGAAGAAATAAIATGEDVDTIQALYDAIAGTPGGGMKPLLYPDWAPARSIIQAGYVAADGQLLSRATYADAWAQAQAAGLVVTDSVWLGSGLWRGMFSSGDGSTTFRMPDYNGKSAGSYGAVFLRGDGALSLGGGLVQRDALQGHKHRTPGNSAPGDAWAAIDGAESTASATATYSGLATGHRVLTGGAVFSDGNRGEPRTASETRPTNVSGCWVIKMFGAIVNVGSADAAQLASDFATLVGRIDNREGQLGWGQTWQDVTASRVTETTYTNSTGRPIVVYAKTTFSTNSPNFILYCNSQDISQFLIGSSDFDKLVSVSGVIPPGAVYRVSGAPGTVDVWRELR